MSLPSYDPDSGGATSVSRISDEEVLKNFKLLYSGGQELLLATSKQLDSFVQIYNSYISKHQRDKAEELRNKVNDIFEEIMKKVFEPKDREAMRAAMKAAMVKLNSAPRMLMEADTVPIALSFETPNFFGRYERNSDGRTDGGRILPHFHD